MPAAPARRRQLGSLFTLRDQRIAELDRSGSSTIRGRSTFLLIVSPLVTWLWLGADHRRRIGGLIALLGRCHALRSLAVGPRRPRRRFAAYRAAARRRGSPPVRRVPARELV